VKGGKLVIRFVFRRYTYETTSRPRKISGSTMKRGLIRASPVEVLSRGARGPEGENAEQLGERQLNLEVVREPIASQGDDAVHHHRADDGGGDLATPGAGSPLEIASEPHPFVDVPTEIGPQGSEPQHDAGWVGRRGFLPPRPDRLESIRHPLVRVPMHEVVVHAHMCTPIVSPPTSREFRHDESRKRSTRTRNGYAPPR
jgi:hypothetical protein